MPDGGDPPAGDLVAKRHAPQSVVAGVLHDGDGPAAGQGDAVKRRHRNS